MSNSDPITSGTGGVLGQVGGSVLPAPKPTLRVIDWQSIVALAEGNNYRRTVKYAVYHFGNGRQSRVFTEDV